MNNKGLYDLHIANLDFVVNLKKCVLDLAQGTKF